MAHSGTASCRLKDGEFEFGPGLLNEPVEAGDVFTLSFWARYNDASAARGAMVIQLTGPTGNILDSASTNQWFTKPVTSSSSNAWAYYTYSYTVPSGLTDGGSPATGIYLSSYGWNNNTSNAVYFDDVTMSLTHNGTLKYTHSLADVSSSQDYYAFGAIMPGRTYTSANVYRYGFNGKENDNEVKGNANQQDYGFRIYDPRLGRFLSIDPLTRSYPFYTPYSFAGNKPIKFIDIDGLEEGERAAQAGAALVKWTNEKIESALKNAKLGSNEGRVVKANPVDAYRSRNTNNMAFAIQLAAGFGFREDDAGDAFRHTYWNVLMTKRANKDFAKQMGEAHEKDNPNTNPLTTKMDLLNNEIGQKLAEDNPNATDQEFALKVLDKVKNGETYVVGKNEKGEAALVKSHMTDDEYNTAKKAINAVDFSKEEESSSKDSKIDYHKK